MLEKANGKHAQTVTATSVHFAPADEFSDTEGRFHGKSTACFNFTVITLREGTAAHVCVSQLWQLPNFWIPGRCCLPESWHGERENRTLPSTQFEGQKTGSDREGDMNSCIVVSP